jgi:hypothetical protein
VRYDKFERDAKGFGMDVDDALGYGLSMLIKNVFP